MVLCHDEKWLVCCHNEGKITILNTQDMTSKSISPFGYIDNMWGLNLIPMPFNQLMEKFTFCTSDGLQIGMITAEGEFQTCDESFFKSCNVTNAQIIKADLLLCTINDKNGISKLVMIDIEANKSKLVIDQKEKYYSFDLEKIPGTGEDAFFILH